MISHCQAGRDCQSFYQNYNQGIHAADSSDLDCQAVVFFYRINRMLDLSCNALRQQIVNTEQRRLEKEVKELLSDWSADPDKKKQYLTGRQVELAEELGKYWGFMYIILVRNALVADEISTRRKPT